MPQDPYDFSSELDDIFGLASPSKPKKNKPVGFVSSVLSDEINRQTTKPKPAPKPADVSYPGTVMKFVGSRPMSTSAPPSSLMSCSGTPASLCR